MSRTGRRVLLVVVFWTALALSGCRNPEKPRYRLGCLPFPGLFTLHDLADPDDLGTHRYEQALPLLSGEADRGTLYACKAGFLDLAHMRDSMDRTKYFFGRIESALLDAEPGITIKMAEPDKFVLSFRYPPDWLTMPTENRALLARELAVLLAQEMTLISTTWHEIITFYGYKSTMIIPEAQSAFTYDDMVSHVVGMEVGARALANSNFEFNHAATIALDERLSELQVVSEAQCGEAIKAVEGLWWDDGESFKRQLDIALDDREITPWLVPDFAPCGEAEPEPILLPRLDNVRGRDFEGFMEVEIAPNFFEWDSVQRLLPGDPKPERVRPYEHFPIILRDVRAQLLAALGENFDRADLKNVKLED